MKVYSPIEVYLNLYKNKGTCSISDATCTQCCVPCKTVIADMSTYDYKTVRAMRYKLALEYLNSHKDELLEKLL